jgi:hypothetical protein
VACGDGVGQLLELTGRGALDQDCRQRVSMVAGVSQLRTAWGHLEVGPSELVLDRFQDCSTQWRSP